MRKMLAPLVLLLLPGFCGALPGGLRGGPEWHDDLDGAFALATEGGRPLLIVFR